MDEAALFEEPPKCVCLCVDCSDSMNCAVPTRIVKARDSLVMILDEHLADHDYCALYRFHTITELVFSLQLVGPVREKLKSMAAEACFTQGATALYDVGFI